MVLKKALALMTTLILTIVSLVASPQALAAEPAHAGWVSDTREALEKLGEFVDAIWDSVVCLTDLDCLISNATVSIANNINLVLVGTTFDDINKEKLEAMIRGEWYSGLAFAAGGAIDEAYSNPPGLRELNLASHLKHELSDNLLNRGAYAQTTGEVLLEPIEFVWNAIRRVAYALFFAIMVAIGFMIMFRRQVSARVVLSFTNALPRIIVSLVLITFSFSLIALTFDVISVIGSRIAFEALRTEETTALLDELTTFPSEEGENEAEEATTGTGGVLEESVGASATKLVGHFLSKQLLPFVTTGGEAAAVALRTLILSVGFLFALTITLIAIVIQIAYRGAKILLTTVLSPIILLIGSLPGQEAVLGKFAQGLIADCAVFPVVALMFSLSFLLIAKTIEFHPFYGTHGVLGGLVGNTFYSLLTLVFLVMTFIVPSKIANTINPKKGK